MASQSAPAPPDPAAARTPAEYVDALNELRGWAGNPSLRRLRQLGGRMLTPAGDEVDALPPSTTSHLLNGRGLPRLPRLEFVRPYVSSCFRAIGHPPEQIEQETARWVQTWRALSTPGDLQPGDAQEPLPPEDGPPGTEAPPAQQAAHSPATTVVSRGNAVLPITRGHPESAPVTAAARGKRLLQYAALAVAGGAVGYLLASQFIDSDGSGSSGDSEDPPAAARPAGEFYRGKVTWFAEKHGLDLDTKGGANTDRRKPGNDVNTWGAGNVLATDSQLVSFASLPQKGPLKASRCNALRDGDWRRKVSELRKAADPGYQVCAITSENRLAIITFRRKPSASQPTLDFDYVVWNTPYQPATNP